MDRRLWFKLMTAAGSALALKPLSNLEFIHPLDDPSEDLARLCYNENPFGPSQSVRKAISDAFDISHQYPFAYVEDLAKQIAKKHGVTREHVVVTGGSREGLNSTALTFAEEGGNIVAPYPTYQAMLTYAKQFGMHVYDVPLDENLGHDLEAMEKRMTNRTNLIFVCNPNNPSGTLISTPTLRDFVKSVSKRSVVFVDEAYYDYVVEDGFSSQEDLVKEDLNVIVSRTFSKVYGMAGIRIGYLLARPDLAQRIRQNLMASTNIPAIIGASVALEDKEFYDFSRGKNQEGKDMIYGVLNDLGLEYGKSQTNFVFFKSGINIVELNQKMKARGVLVGRPFPPLLDWCRVSTGKTEDVARFCTELKTVFS